MELTFMRVEDSRLKCACVRIVCFMCRARRTCCGACSLLRSVSARRRGLWRGTLGGRSGWRSSLPVEVQAGRRKRLLLLNDSNLFLSSFFFFGLLRRLRKKKIHTISIIYHFYFTCFL